jgi:hypothetical protein
MKLNGGRIEVAQRNRIFQVLEKEARLVRNSIKGQRLDAQS